MSRRNYEKSKLYQKGSNGTIVYFKQPFESRRAGDTSLDDVNKEPKCTLYLSMLTSDAWLNLSGGSMKLYPYMKMQAYSGNKNKDYRKDRDKRKLTGTEFYFNKCLLRKAYPGLYPNLNQFYKDLRGLIDNGFIKIVDPGTYFDKTIYDLSDDWQHIPRRKRDTSKATEAAQEKRKEK